MNIKIKYIAVILIHLVIFESCKNEYKIKPYDDIYELQIKKINDKITDIARVSILKDIFIKNTDTINTISAEIFKMIEENKLSDDKIDKYKKLIINTCSDEKLAQGLASSIKNKDIDILYKIKNTQLILLYNEYTSINHMNYHFTTISPIVYRNKDTILVGQKIFTSVHLSGKNDFFPNYAVFENGDTLETYNGMPVFSETSLKKGNISHKGYIYVYNYDKYNKYPFEINYYVK